MRVAHVVLAFFQRLVQLTHVVERSLTNFVRKRSVHRDEQRQRRQVQEDIDLRVHLHLNSHTHTTYAITHVCQTKRDRTDNDTLPNTFVLSSENPSTSVHGGGTISIFLCSAFFVCVEDGRWTRRTLDSLARLVRKSTSRNLLFVWTSSETDELGLRDFDWESRQDEVAELIVQFEAGRKRLHVSSTFGDQFISSWSSPCTLAWASTSWTKQRTCLPKRKLLVADCRFFANESCLAFFASKTARKLQD